MYFNRNKVTVDPESFWLREWTKVKHLTQIITFSDKKISTMRLFDFGINVYLVTTHILKGGSNFNEDDPFASVTDDLTIKEPAGIVYSNTSSLRVEPFNLTSDYLTVQLTEKTDEAGNRVLHLYENSTHPHKFHFDFDIFYGDDEPLTLFQEQDEKGHFHSMHSRLALESRGLHHYYAFRKLQDEPDLETLTNVQVHTGNQLYNKGKTV